MTIEIIFDLPSLAIVIVGFAADTGKDVGATVGRHAIALALGADLGIPEKDGDLGIDLFLICELGPPGRIVPDQKPSPEVFDVIDNPIGNLDLGLPGRSDAVLKVLRFDEATEHDVAGVTHGRLARPEDDIVESRAFDDLRIVPAELAVGIL